MKFGPMNVIKKNCGLLSNKEDSSENKPVKPCVTVYKLFLNSPVIYSYL